MKKTYARFFSICMLLFGSVLLCYGAFLYLCYGAISFAWSMPLIGGILLVFGIWEVKQKEHLLFRFPLKGRCILIGLFTVLFTFFVWIQGSILWEGAVPSSTQADVAIVLGAQLQGSKITRTLRYRLESALEFAQKYPDSILIVSGGKGKDEAISEAAAMKKWLIEHGVKGSRILTEDASTNTAQNFAYSLRKIKDDTDHVSIITNGFHMKRSKMLCEREVKSCSAYPADSGKDLAPIFYFREFFAYVKDWLLS